MYPNPSQLFAQNSDGTGEKKPIGFTTVGGVDYLNVTTEASLSSSDLEGKGKVSVGTTAVEITFTGESSSIIISADSDNTGKLYIGKSNVTSDGSNAVTFLEAGESVTLDYNDVTNALYVVASAVSQNFWAGTIIA